MQITSLTFPASLSLCVACTVTLPGSSDSDTGSSGDLPSTSSTSDEPGSTTEPEVPTTGDASTGDASTGDTSTGDASTGDASTGDASTGDELTCPIGQPSLAPLWSTTLPVSEFPDIRAGHRVVVLDDGTIVIDGNTTTDEGTAPGVFRVAGDGGAAEWHAGASAPQGMFMNIGMRVAADASIVVLGWHQVEPSPEPYIARFAADGTELSRIDLQTTEVRRLWNFELDGDAAVVIGHGHGSDPGQWLARVDVATGIPAWEIELPALEGPMPGVVDVGPGGEIVAGHGSWPNFGDPEFKLWRVDAGAVAWERDLLPPGPGEGLMNDVVVTSGGEVVALTWRKDPEHRLVATALALADGAPLWELDVAVTDDSGIPSARRWLLDDDALTLAVVRAKDGAPHGVELHRVSFDGVHLGAAPLATDGIKDAPPRLTAVRGACGELLLFQDNLQTPWLAAFAP